MAVSLLGDLTAASSDSRSSSILLQPILPGEGAHSGPDPSIRPAGGGGNRTEGGERGRARGPGAPPPAAAPAPSTGWLLDAGPGRLLGINLLQGFAGGRADESVLVLQGVAEGRDGLLGLGADLAQGLGGPLADVTVLVL